ncbi:MAG: hypothetical protein ACI9DC_004459 [Gammaproteobacteria bacterium]|jgi:hypothetical protein
MADHLTGEELEAGLAHILESPRDSGRLEAIVARPEHNQRNDLQSCEISLARGVYGERGCWMSTEDG